MTDRPPPEERVDKPPEAEHDEPHPRGTMFLMMLFLIAIVAMWGYIYLMMLQRG
jgi:hypothetical protein